MTKLTIEEANIIYSCAMKDVKRYHVEGYRLGQAIFNCLVDKNNDVANEIRGTVRDMYYTKDNTQARIMLYKLTE